MVMRYLFLEVICSLISFSGYLIGIIVGILSKQQHYAVQAAPIIVTILVVFGGVVVKLTTLPDYSGWIQYITPLSYGYNLLMRI